MLGMHVGSSRVGAAALPGDGQVEGLAVLTELSHAAATALVSATRHGPSVRMGTTPSQWAARRNGFVPGQVPPTDTGMRGCCSGGG
jgi:hypothetical protein